MATKEDRYRGLGFGNEPNVKETKNFLIWSQRRYHSAKDRSCFETMYYVVVKVCGYGVKTRWNGLIGNVQQVYMYTQNCI